MIKYGGIFSGYNWYNWYMMASWWLVWGFHPKKNYGISRIELRSTNEPFGVFHGMKQQFFFSNCSTGLSWKWQLLTVTLTSGFMHSGAPRSSNGHFYSSKPLRCSMGIEARKTSCVCVALVLGFQSSWATEILQGSWKASTKTGPHFQYFQLSQEPWVPSTYPKTVSVV